jgi:protein TonB
MPHSPPRRHRVGWFTQVSRCVFFTALAGAWGCAAAQAAPSAASAVDSSPSARAQREADKVFQWIRIHSDKPRKAAAAADKPAPAPVKVARPAKPADSGITETVQAMTPAPATRAARVDPAAPPIPSTPAVTTPTSRPEPAVAVARHEPAPPPAAPAVASPDEDMALTPIHKTEPEFPSNLMRTLRRGLVQVSFTVQPDGTVAQPQVLSSTHPRLAPAAMATVSPWRFQPLRHAQQAVVDLGFNLD